MNKKKTTLIEASKYVYSFVGLLFYNREASPMPAIFMMMWVRSVAKIFHTPLNILDFFSTPLFLKKIDCLLFSRGLKIHCHCKNCSEHKCLDLPRPELRVLALFSEVNTETPVFVCFLESPRECQIYTLITHYFKKYYFYSQLFNTAWDTFCSVSLSTTVESEGRLNLCLDKLFKGMVDSGSLLHNMKQTIWYLSIPC